jgi:hypothetical protein
VALHGLRAEGTANPFGSSGSWGAGSLYPRQALARRKIGRHLRHESFEWKTKRDSMRIAVIDDGYVRTFPLKKLYLRENEGYEPADFDRHIEVSGGSGSAPEIDENMLLEEMPDFHPVPAAGMKCRV